MGEAMPSWRVGWAENQAAAPKKCRFEHNFTHGVFEGHRLGAFVDSSIRFEAADGIGDDWVEFEYFKKRSSKNNRVIACKVLNCHASFISAQDTNKQMPGPNFVSRCIFDSTDDKLCHPHYVIKNRGLKNSSYKLHFFNNFVRNPGGANAGSGHKNLLWWDQREVPQNRPPHHHPDRIALRNNLVVFDRGKISAGNAPTHPTVSNNLLINDDDRPDITKNGGRRLGGNASALRREANGKLKPNSPAIGAGSNNGLTGSGFVDVDFGGGDFTDVGPFPKDFDPGAIWPRPFERAFSPNPIPKRWPF